MSTFAIIHDSHIAGGSLKIYFNGTNDELFVVPKNEKAETIQRWITCPTKPVNKKL